MAPAERSTPVETEPKRRVEAFRLSSGSPTPEPDPAPSRDFRITDALRIGEGSLRDKVFDNMEAIRALKRIGTRAMKLFSAFRQPWRTGKFKAIHTCLGPWCPLI